MGRVFFLKLLPIVFRDFWLLGPIAINAFKALEPCLVCIALLYIVHVVGSCPVPFAKDYLRDRLDRCAVLFGRGHCEITLPFLPSQALPILEAAQRRIYLSATLSSVTDFIRAFGKRPDVRITPDNDAGNGERLVLSDEKIAGGLSPATPSRLKSSPSTKPRSHGPT
ncbi:MAG TPA: hypothetical protein VGO52_08615 [Hyphomonadaceae bacterium]|nr:hypothetical protein [Hyphomonadaceae bacterium]